MKTQFGRQYVELFVVVAVIFVCLALLIPAVHQARESARKSQSRNNLRQIGLALHNYHDVHNCFPAGGIFDQDGRGHWGWLVAVAMYLDSNTLHSRLDFNQSWDSTRNAGELLFTPTAFQIPGETAAVGHWEFGAAHYSANSHLLAANFGARLKDIDSPNQTFITAELSGDFLPWPCAYNWRSLTSLNGDPPTFGRYSKEGAFFLFVDGHVAFASNEVFANLRDSLRGHDLAAEVEEKSVVQSRPKTFPVPKETLKPEWVRLSGEYRGATGMKDYRGRIVRLSTTNELSKAGPDAAGDEDIPIIAAYISLEELELRGDFTDARLPMLGKLVELRRLHLESNDMTEAGLAFVEKLPKLKVVTVMGSQVSKDVRDRLRGKLGGCDVLPQD